MAATQYAYKVKDARGRLVEGKVEADTEAGEAGGFLDVTMRQIAENFEAEVKLRGKIKAAMTYPVVVFCLAILMCMGMLIFVVPVFEDIFAPLGGKLPLPTQVLVTLSHWM